MSWTKIVFDSLIAQQKELKTIEKKQKSHDEHFAKIKNKSFCLKKNNL
jgi:hypothetical protein